MTAEVRAAVQRWLDATVAGDADVLERLVTADHTFTHATSGNVDGRAAWLQSFRDGTRRYHVWTIANEWYRAYPDLLLVQGDGHQEMGPTDNRRVLDTRFLCAWVREAGEWRCAAWQATQVAPH